ncbi:MAG: hypothetical protein JOS17DRAFT_787550 [Linnemannia elongata]|nr:MAG: hypothetical protein JOS17DRAFT_787550 [Linnemannia elongata]
MSFFDIPELAEQVGYHLTSNDLAVCIRVSKTWHILFTPHLWHTVPPLPGPNESDDNSNNHPLQLFSRNGHLVRVLGLVQHHLRDPQTVQRFGFRESRAQASLWCTKAELIRNPTDLELLYYLLERCTNLTRLWLLGRCLNISELEPWKRIVRTGLPGTLTDLTIKLDLRLSLGQSSFPPVLFSRCSPRLQSLRLDIRRSSGSYSREILDQPTSMEEDGDGEPLPLLKELRVTCQDKQPYPPSWPRFLNRCTHLESLRVTSIDPSWIHALSACVELQSLRLGMINSVSLRHLTSALRGGLPKLSSIRLDKSPLDTTDRDVVDMLAASHKGWRSVAIPIMGPLAVQALIQHCSTLEELDLTMAYGLTSKDMQRILSSSPRLVTFITLECDYHYLYSVNETTHILATDFIDANPSSEFLKPWACESSLKVFRAKISGIPRPDITKTFHGHPVKNGMVLQEAHSGQSQEILHRVYERLGRLKRLERLELGQEDRNTFDETRTFDEPGEVETLDDEDQQYDCLDMNIRSGLRMLEGLKQLSVLSVVRMATLIGVEEVQWMVQSWPKLKRLDGLNYAESDEVDAYKWLREHCPRIQSSQCDRAGIYN